MLAKRKYHFLFVKDIMKYYIFIASKAKINKIISSALTYVIAYAIIYYVSLCIFEEIVVLYGYKHSYQKIRTELCLSQGVLVRGLHFGFTSVNRWKNNKSKPNQIAQHELMSCVKQKIDNELI